MIVHHVGKMIRGQAVLLDDHRIHNVFRHGDLSPEHIVKYPELALLAGALEPDHEALALSKIFQNLLLGQAAAGGPLAVIALLQGVFLFRALAQRCAVLLRAEAGIRHVLFQQMLGKGLVNIPAQGLAVRAVIAVILCLIGRTFIKQNGKILQRADDLHNAVFHLALLIGVLDPQEEYATPLLGIQAINQSCIQTADVHKARGAGSKPGGGIGRTAGSGRIECLIIGVGFGDIGEDRICNALAHGKTLSFREIRFLFLAFCCIVFYHGHKAMSTFYPVRRCRT